MDGDPVDLPTPPTSSDWTRDYHAAKAAWTACYGETTPCAHRSLARMTDSDFWRCTACGTYAVWAGVSPMLNTEVLRLRASR